MDATWKRVTQPEEFRECPRWRKGRVGVGKGGGYGRTFGGVVGVRLRHRYWTGTTDLPRPPVPPLDGGLEKKPNTWKRFVNWFKWVIKGGK